MTDLDPQELIGELQLIAPRLATKLTRERIGYVRELLALRDERDNLLAALVEGHEHLRDGVRQLTDLPPDTVLGESGTQAIRELDAAEAAIGGRLANYPDGKATSERVATRRDRIAHWAQKVLAEKRKNAKLKAVVDAVYDAGWRDAVRLYAVWRDGAQYVGVMERKLIDVLEGGPPKEIKACSLAATEAKGR